MSAPALALAAAPPSARVLVLPGLPESVRQFRAMARELAATPYQAEAAALCVSELATNAIIHSRSGTPGGSVMVMIESAPTPGALRISVLDEGTSWAEGGAIEPGPQNGYGLGIVAAVAARWGMVPAAGGCSLTWCDIAEARS